VYQHERGPNPSTFTGGTLADLDVNKKAAIYEDLSSLNTAFAGIVQHLQTLNKTGLFHSKASKLLPSFVQELQAECNQEFLESLHQLELDEWGSYGKVRQKWEKYLRGPEEKKKK
jgi:hypothetical protein